MIKYLVLIFISFNCFALQIEDLMRFGRFTNGTRCKDIISSIGHPRFTYNSDGFTSMSYVSVLFACEDQFDLLRQIYVFPEVTSSYIGNATKIFRMNKDDVITSFGTPYEERNKRIYYRYTNETNEVIADIQIAFYSTGSVRSYSVVFF